MTSVKTAISLREPLFEQVETVARDLQISRSRLFALAVEDFIQRYQNQKLLESINKAYDDLPDPEEMARQREARTQHRRLVEREW